MKKIFAAFVFFCLLTPAFASLPYFPINFPRDEGAHYKNVPYKYSLLTEWWYFNGRVVTDDGKKLSYDIALFNPAFNLVGLIRQPIVDIQISKLDDKTALGTRKIYPLNSGTVSTDKLDIVLENDYSLKQIEHNGKKAFAL